MLHQVAGADARPALPVQVLMAVLSGECYGADVTQVRGIDAPPALALVPGAPPVVLGVYSRQGSLTAAVDPRVPLGLPRTDQSPGHLVVVEAGGYEAALRVDEVLEVVDLDRAHLQPLPAVAEGALLQGSAQAAGRLILVLDLPTLLATIARQPRACSAERGPDGA
jgi:purine-binding chemotaxis protein CheW